MSYQGGYPGNQGGPGYGGGYGGQQGGYGGGYGSGNGGGNGGGYGGGQPGGYGGPSRGYGGQGGQGGQGGGYGGPPGGPPGGGGYGARHESGYGARHEDGYGARHEDGYGARHDGGYGGGGYQQPPPQQPRQGYGQYPGQGGPPQQSRQSNRYPAPPYAPPPGLDSHGYQTVQGYGGSHRAGPPPPSAPQSFGHGAPDGYTFQYSNCTGRRKALLIGINYFGQDGELAGCINDTKNLFAFLSENHGYKREDTIILTDDQRDPNLVPTKANIIRAMQWLVRDAQPNDSLFLHYSGHGGQAQDLDGDEDDGFDEVIYPVDFKQAGHIVDDELHHVVVKPLVAGVRLTAIFDCCHSGSSLDLPYLYSTKGILKEPNLAAEAGQGLLKAITSYASGDTGGAVSAVMSFAKSAIKGNSGHKKTIETKTSPADVIMWSGSKDDQTSADATIASKATGAMSWAFVTALKQDPKQSYVELLNSIRDVLETKYEQKPQLSCSHPLDTDLLFVM